MKDSVSKAETHKVKNLSKYDEFMESLAHQSLSKKQQSRSDLLAETHSQIEMAVKIENAEDESVCASYREGKEKMHDQRRSSKEKDPLKGNSDCALEEVCEVSNSYPKQICEIKQENEEADYSGPYGFEGSDLILESNSTSQLQ